MSSRSKRSYRVVPLMALALLVTGLAAAGDHALTVEVHCEVTKRLLQIYEAEWSERVAAAAANRGDQKSLLRALGTITTRHGSERAVVCNDYQTSVQAMARFSNERQREIRDYLESHREVAADLESARKRVSVLIGRFESMMEEARREKK